jgi:hypothetical protein
LWRIGEEVFRTTRVIYIEPLASKLPPAFQRNIENFGEDRNVEREII